MPDGGTLKLEAKKLPGSDKTVSISFSDTGLGISKEALARIFEPLFTTKAKGIGLGLAIVNDIIKQHNGKITVESNPPKGTTFTVLLPT